MGKVVLLLQFIFVLHVSFGMEIDIIHNTYFYIFVNKV